MRGAQAAAASAKRRARETGPANPVSCLSVTLGRRKTWARTAIGSAALAAVTVLTIAGCSAPPAPASAVTTADHTLSLSAAKQVYDRYLAASDSAAARGNQTLALAIAGGTLWSQLKGQYTALTSTGIPIPRYRYGQPVFYVPGLSGYPEWFMVAVPRQTDTGGHLGPAVNTLLLFDRYERAAPWTLNGVAVLDQPLPAIARDQAGYAIAVVNNDASLLVRPDVVGATQAAVLDEGPDNPAAAVIASGPQTTGLYAAQAATARADAAAGVNYQWLAQYANQPQFEVRTTDGGALTMYGIYLNTTAEHPNLATGSPIPVPAAISALFTKHPEIGYHAVYADWTYQFAAVDPPGGAHNAKVDVIASTGYPTYSHAY
jgi:hypothetical protein